MLLPDELLEELLELPATPDDELLAPEELLEELLLLEELEEVDEPLLEELLEVLEGAGLEEPPPPPQAARTTLAQIAKARFRVDTVLRLNG